MQATIDQINDQILEASLGYALMDVMSDDDLGRGPTLTSQTINIREISGAFLKQFSANVKLQGLANKVVANAIVVGVKTKHIETGSLEAMKPGPYTNVVKWTSAAREDGAEMILYNGNHRRTYMRTSSQVVTQYHQHLIAKKELAVPQTPSHREVLASALVNTLDVVEKHGKWLVHFIDEGKQKISGRAPIHSDKGPQFRCDQEVGQPRPPAAHPRKQRAPRQLARQRRRPARPDTHHPRAHAEIQTTRLHSQTSGERGHVIKGLEDSVDFEEQTPVQHAEEPGGDEALQGHKVRHGFHDAPAGILDAFLLRGEFCSLDCSL